VDEILTANQVPVVSMDNSVPAKTQVENLSLRDNDFAADMAKLRASTGMTVEVQPEPIQLASPTTPAQPETAAVTETDKAPVVVPEKFKAADGSVDTEKLGKSITNVDEALASYLEKEKELKRKMNEVKAKENTYLTPPATPTPNPVIPVNTDFAKKLEEDIAKDGAGVVLAKLFTAAQESVEERVQERIKAIESHNAANTTKQQVEAIGKSDPWVYTPEGLTTLTQILDTQPYLWNAPDPYKAAYLQYKGQQNVSVKSSSQVLTTTPPARPTAPVPSGQAVNQTQAPKDFSKMSSETLQAHLKTLTPEQEREFFARQGFPKY
jgi:hypothetical protein